MRITYIDESGSTGRAVDPDQPVHFVVGVSLPGPEVQPVNRALRDIARGEFGAKSGHPNFEFKGSDMYGRDGWFRGMHPRDAISLYMRVLALLPAHGAEVYVAGTSKERAHAEGIHPHYDASRRLVHSLDALSDRPTMLLADDHTT